jgi:fucose permease
MQVLVALTVGLVAWIFLWAGLNVKPFDAFLIPLFLVVIAATMQIAQPYITKLLKP